MSTSILPNETDKTATESINLAARRILDIITSKHTAFLNFAELISAGSGYRPSIRTRNNKAGVELGILADAYDHCQKLRGDNRRAYRS